MRRAPRAAGCCGPSGAYHFKGDFNGQYCAARSIAAARALNPELKSFDAWLEINARLIPLE